MRFPLDKAALTDLLTHLDDSIWNAKRNGGTEAQVKTLKFVQDFVALLVKNA